MPTDELAKALEPKKIIKIFLGIFLIGILGVALIFGIRMASNTASTMEATSRDHAWFTQTLEEINSLNHQISETKRLRTEHQESIDSRLISRLWVSEEDRNEAVRLSRELSRMEERRAVLVRNYNTAAELADPKTLGNLPKNASIEGE